MPSQSKKQLEEYPVHLFIPLLNKEDSRKVTKCQQILNKQDLKTNMFLVDDSIAHQWNFNQIFQLHMASSIPAKAYSLATSEYTYDIFLSFRGEDTRNSFTTILYAALVKAGFGTFIDDNGIERGEDIKTELTRAINHSRGSIIVLSENYANSGWCLDELAMIVENKKKKGNVILPVFYYVTPLQVGKQMDSYRTAFEWYEERVKQEKDEEKRSKMVEDVKKWRDALSTVAEIDERLVLREQHDSDDGHTRFIPKVVQVIEDRLSRAVMTGARDLIGMRSRVRDIDLWLKDASSNADKIRFIQGVGGVGKTTVAKYVYIKNGDLFHAKSFLEDVRETCDQPNGLISLQKKLLSDIFGGDKITISSVDEGIARIRDALYHRRVLLVLDDVDQVHQLNAILGTRDWLSTGSKVIITTRHEKLLSSDEVYKVHKVKPFGFDDSLQLFSWYAFGLDSPSKNFRDLSLRVLERCEGLPLALKVIGLSLLRKGQDVWESLLRKLEEIPNNHVLKLLQISFLSLPDRHDRDLFLHIACFFVGKDKRFVAKILDECGFQTTLGIQILINKGLLTVNGANALTMHQLIQDMGRYVVRGESPDKPGMRSRLWHYKDSFDVLRDEEASDKTVGFVLDMRHFLEYEPDNTISFSRDAAKGYDLSLLMANVKIGFSPLPAYKSSHLVLKTDAFDDMYNLELLQLNYVHLTGRYKNFPKKIKWLCWHGFPLKSLPSDFLLENLVALDMSKSKLTHLWRQNKAAAFMKILDLSHCRELLRTPEFSGLPSLEKLILEDCISLSEVHESIGSLNCLYMLVLEDCKALRKLPETITKLKHLETLILSGCSNLRAFPKEMAKLVSLKVLRADRIAKLEAISTNVYTSSWHAHILTRLFKPKRGFSIPWLSLPPSLVILNVSNSNLTVNTFPKDLSYLVLLEEMNLSGNPLLRLPEGISSLTRLQKLTLVSCKRLRSIHGLPDVKNIMINGCRSLETITHVSESFKLQLIDYENCENLVEVQGFFKLEPIAKLSPEKLKNLGFSKSGSMEIAEVNIQDGITFNTKKRSSQLLYEFGIFSTSIPGSEIPDWYFSRSYGSSVSFTVPPVPIFGLNICFVYAVSNIIATFFTNLSKESWTPEHQLFTKVTNRTKNLTWIYYPTCFGIPDYRQDLLWLSHWTFKDQMESGDEVDVSIICGDTFQIKMCGVDFVYNELDGDTKKTYLSWKETIGGDLSAFRLSTGAHYLCRTHILRNDKATRRSMLEDWTVTKWGRSLFGGSVDFEEVRFMNWTGRH